MKTKKGIRDVLVSTDTPGGGYTIKTKGGDKPTSLVVQKPFNRANCK